MQVKLILFDSFDFFRQNLRQIASLCLPVLFIDAFIESSLTGYQNLHFLSFVSYVALYPIYTAALILFMAKSANKEHSKNINLIASSLKLWWPFFILTVFSIFLSVVGFVLFIIPGIWVAVRLTFAEFFLILYGKDPWEAIRQSFKITKQYFWLLFSFLISFIFIYAIFDYLIDYTINNLILSITANSFCALIMLFFNVILFRIFMVAVMKKPIA